MARKEELHENKMREGLENWETVVAQAKERGSQKGGVVISTNIGEKIK